MGDARETLASLPGPVGFLLLDGWKDLYLPVLRLLEPRLAPGALVVADDTISMAAQMTDYLSYVRDPAHGYLSVSFPESDGLEITCGSDQISVPGPGGTNHGPFGPIIKNRQAGGGEVRHAGH